MTIVFREFASMPLFSASTSLESEIYLFCVSSCHTEMFSTSLLAQGTPPSARHIPIFALFSPLFILQGAAVLYAFLTLVEKLVLLLDYGTIDTRYLRISSNVHDFFAFVHHGSRYYFTCSPVEYDILGKKLALFFIDYILSKLTQIAWLVVNWRGKQRRASSLVLCWRNWVSFSASCTL